MKDDRSNNDRMTLAEAGKPNMRKPSWVTGPITAEPGTGPRYRLSQDAYLYDRMIPEGTEVNWPGKPGVYMVPVNDEARKAKHDALLEDHIRDKHRSLIELSGKTPGIQTTAIKDVTAEIARLEAEYGKVGKDEFPDTETAAEKKSRERNEQSNQQSEQEKEQEITKLRDDADKLKAPLDPTSKKHAK